MFIFNGKFGRGRSLYRSAACWMLKGQRSDLVSDLPHPVQLQCHELYRRSETGPSRLLAHVRAWNKLPPPLRRVFSPATFKRQLNTFYIQSRF